MTLNIAVIPGDGIGKEIVPEGLKVLDRVLADKGVDYSTTHFDLGAQRWHATGDTLTDEDLEAIKRHDVILLGAVGDPSVPSGVLERGLLLKLRFALDHYVNLRPSKYYEGVPSPLANPGDIDFVVVREGTEGLYCGNGGAVRVGTPHEIATEVSVNTAYGVERVVRYAFEAAASRKKHLTLVHKHNVLVNAGHMWRRIVDEVGEEYPEVRVDYCHIDAATIYMVTDPARFDVIVTDNLFGDILTDEAGAVTGGIGLSASGNLNPSRVPLHVRARARLCPRHRGTGHGGPDRDHLLGRADARLHGLRRGSRARARRDRCRHGSARRGGGERSPARALHLADRR